MAKMNGGHVPRIRGRDVLSVVLCLSIFHLRGTSAQSTGLNETQVSNMIRDDINEIQQLGQEFSANFFTDLAPLLILFGDQVVRQYMAQSQGWADHIIFAMGPLGVATALIGAVRMCGKKFLRGVVGRGRETKQMAEFELTSATSEDVYEVWDGESIVRVLGEHTFQEIRLQKEGEKVDIKQLFHEVTEKDSHIPFWKRWSWSDRRKSASTPTSAPADDLEKTLPNDEDTQDEVSLYRRKTRMGPNLSLNAIPEDISPRQKWICAGISVVLQICVIVWAALVQYKLPAPKFRKDGRMGEFRQYAFPCMVVGTLAVVTSMLICSYVVDKVMERKLIRPVSKTPMQWRPCWIQKWGKVDDQTFDSYIIFGRLRNTQNPGDGLMTLHPRRKHDDLTPLESSSHFGEREIPGFLARITEVACVLGIMGFFVMVAGTRSLHWSVPAAQLIQTLLMVLLRSYIRRKMNADDIRVMKLPRGFEMEWLVTRLDELWEELETWDKKGRKYRRDGVQLWEPQTNKKWGFVTGEKVVRALEMKEERGSITRGANLPEFNRDDIIEFETLDTLDSLGKLKPTAGAQRALNELKSLLQNNKSWEGNLSGLGIALVKTMVSTLNTLLPPAVMNSMPLSKIGLVNSAPGQGPTAQPWPENTAGLMWHWPLVVQMEVNSDDGPKMEEQIVRISLIQRETGKWFVMKEAVEALLTLWLFTLKQQRLKFVKLKQKQSKKSNQVKLQPEFVRLIGSNTELTRWDTMRWYVDHCSRVYEGTPITFTKATIDQRRADEIDIEMDRSLGQVMGIEQVDLRSEEELANEHGGVQHQLTPEDQATVHWHYFRGRELPQILYDDWPESGEGQYTSLATTIECTLEELCAQEILFRFFFAIGTFMREERGIRVLGNTILSYRNTTTTSSKSFDANDSAPEKRLKAAKFHNSILDRIAMEAYQSKVCGSLEEAYQCIIPAFSQARVLPEVGEAVSSQVTQIFRALVGKGDWIKACDLYKWVWDSMGCKFPHHSNEDLHAIALFTNFVRKLRHEANTGCHGGSLTKKLAARGEEMLKLITDQEFRGRDVVRALGLMLHSLDELDGAMQAEVVESELTKADSTQPPTRRNNQEGSNGHDAAEPSEEGALGVRLEDPAEGEVRQRLEDDKLELRRLKEEVEKLLPLLGFTPSHKTTAHVLGAGSPKNTDLERDANILDILQRRPLHYAAANPKLESSTLEFLIGKTSGVDQRDINGNTPLHLAASRNNLNFTAALRKLLLGEDSEMRKKATVDFNATNELKWTPLHFAAWKGHQDMVDELIKGGAIIDADDIINRSPLHWAAQGGHLDVVNALIRKRANTKAMDAYGRSPLHVAVAMGNAEVAAELLAHGASLEDADKEGKRALDIVIELLGEKCAGKEKTLSDLGMSEEEKAAAFTEDIGRRFGSLLDTLLASKEEKAKGWTALHCAAHRGEGQAVSMLLDLDAKLNANIGAEGRIANKTDRDHETALHVAARGGHVEVAEILISDKPKNKTNLRIHNNFHEDALMVAVKNNKPDVVHVLLEATAAERIQDVLLGMGEGARGDPSVDIVSPAEHDDNMGMYPLHWAAWQGSLELVRMLVERGVVDLCKRDRVGMFAIHHAALMGHYNVVEYLLHRNPDLIDAIDKARDTPLHCAAAGGRVNVVQLLLDRFMDRNLGYSESDRRLTAFVNKKNDHGETPLHCAAKGLINAGIEKPVLAYKGVTLDTSMWKNLDLATTDWQKALISRICACFPREWYINKITARDCESLNQGIRNWQEEFVRLLLRIDSDRDALSVSEECERKVVELLLNNKANIEATDKDEETPLHLAARWGRLTIAETLLKRLPLPPDQPSEKWEKANVCATDIHKETPLHLAARWGHQELVRVFYHEQAPLEARNKFEYTPCQVAEVHLQFHISNFLKKLLSGSGADLSYLSEFSSSDFEESAIPGMRNAGTTANVEASSASFGNYPNRASNSGHGSGSGFALDESSVNVLPRTDPPPTELEEIRTTLTGLDVQGSLSVPFVPRTSHNQDSGIGADLSTIAPESLGDNRAIETIPDDDLDLGRSSNNSREDPTWLWHNFPNAGSGSSDSAIEPLSPTTRSSTMPVELEYSHNPEQEYEHTSLRRSRQLMSGPRRSSC